VNEANKYLKLIFLIRNRHKFISNIQCRYTASMLKKLTLVRVIIICGMSICQKRKLITYKMNKPQTYIILTVA